MKQISKLLSSVSLLLGIQISSEMELMLLCTAGRNALIETVLTLINKLYFPLRCYTIKLPSKIGANLCDHLIKSH